MKKLSVFDRVKTGVVHGLGFHQWGSWVYEDETSCEKTRRCLICAAKETREEHDWETEENGPCISISTCRRCPKVEENEHHVWGAWEYHFFNPDGYSTRECEVCHTMETT